MKITEVSVWKDRKIQISEYEPLSFAYGMKMGLDNPNDDPQEAKKILEKYVDDWINFETLKYKSPNRAITAGKKLGLYKPANTAQQSIKEDLPF